MLAQRERFELRLNAEKRQRLRAVAAQTAQTESDAIRLLIDAAYSVIGDETEARKEETAAA